MDAVINQILATKEEAAKNAATSCCAVIEPDPR